MRRELSLYDHGRLQVVGLLLGRSTTSGKEVVVGLVGGDPEKPIGLEAHTAPPAFRLDTPAGQRAAVRAAGGEALRPLPVSGPVRLDRDGRLAVLEAVGLAARFGLDVRLRYAKAGEAPADRRVGKIVVGTEGIVGSDRDRDAPRSFRYDRILEVEPLSRPGFPLFSATAGDYELL